MRNGEIVTPKTTRANLFRTILGELQKALSNQRNVGSHGRVH